MDLIHICVCVCVCVCVCSVQPWDAFSLKFFNAMNRIRTVIQNYIISVKYISLLYVILKYYKKVWEELIASFPFIGHGPHRKRHIQ
jgi:hypothetical protein